jgi:hypothetical protein
MSFVCVKGDTEFVPMYCGASSGLTVGELVAYDVSTGAAVSPVISGTASLLAEDVAGVVASTPGTADVYVNVIPIRGQVWKYDCTSTPTTAMLGKVNKLTDSATVANSTTIDTSSAGAVRNLAIDNAAGKTMLGFILGANDAVAN